MTPTSHTPTHPSRTPPRPDTHRTSNSPPGSGPSNGHVSKPPPSRSYCNPKARPCGSTRRQSRSNNPPDQINHPKAAQTANTPPSPPRGRLPSFSDKIGTARLRQQPVSAEPSKDGGGCFPGTETSTTSDTHKQDSQARHSHHQLSQPKMPNQTTRKQSHGSKAGTDAFSVKQFHAIRTMGVLRNAPSKGPKHLHRTPQTCPGPQ